MGTTEHLCRIITGVRYQSLDRATVARTVQAIKDGVAVALAGSGEEPIRIYAQHIKSLGGKPAAHVWGLDFKASTVQAATINAMATHVLDFEPMWNPPTHSVSPTVPVAFALAQACRSSGRDLITAVAKGMEIQGRLLYAGNRYEPEAQHFHPPGVVGVMGAAVTAAHLLGLNELQLRHALGIAGSRAGTLLGNAGSMTKSTHPGYAAGLGLDAALLAARGFTANPDIVETHKGFADAFFPEQFDAARLLAFGKPYRVVDPGLAIKLFPSQFGTHYAITAALDLHAAIGDPNAISKVLITSPVMKYVDRPQPATGLYGKFSLQYTAAAALLDGKVNIDTFTDRRRFRPDMEAMLKKTTLVQTEAIPGSWHNMRVEIEATTRDGRRHHAVCRGPKGCWGQPLSDADHLVKLQDCLGRKLQPAQVARLIELLGRLPADDAGAIGRILALLAGKRPRKAATARTAPRRRT